MAWLKQEADVEVTSELEYSNNGISKTDAYEVEITEAYLQNSKADGSKSISLVISAKTESDETIRTYFTVAGKDGKSYFTQTYNGKTVKKQHIGLTIVNTLFGIALSKEIFDAEPSETSFEVYDKEAKERKIEKGDGFPDLVGKVVGVTAQMNREIDGVKSREYASIEHFFDIESGLFYGEEATNGKPTKLDKWLSSAKEFKETVKETPKSSFGAKKESPKEDGEQPAKRGWGKK